MDQGGGKRKGAFAIYLEPWHADIFDWLELRKNHGKEEVWLASHGRHLQVHAASYLQVQPVRLTSCTLLIGTSARLVLWLVDDRPLHAACGG